MDLPPAVAGAARHTALQQYAWSCRQRAEKLPPGSPERADLERDAHAATVQAFALREGRA